MNLNFEEFYDKINKSAILSLLLVLSFLNNWYTPLILFMYAFTDMAVYDFSNIVIFLMLLFASLLTLDNLFFKKYREDREKQKKRRKKN